MASSCVHFQVKCCVVQKNPSFPENLKKFKQNLSSSFMPLLMRKTEQVVLPIQINVSRTLKDTCSTVLDLFVDSVFEFVDQSLNPYQSNFSPVDELGGEVVVTAIKVVVYIRNGPNPLIGALLSTKSVFGRSRQIWIEGEGMLHAMYFSRDKNDGSWSVKYNNRYVETETFKLEKQRGTTKPSFLPTVGGDATAILSGYLLNLFRFGKVNKDIGNTNVFEHAGKFYAIAENHLPQEVDIMTLQTIGNWDISGAWNRPFNSHPKKAPGSSELVIAGVDAIKPFLEIGIVSGDGELVHKADLKLESCIFCHEIGVTQRYNVIMDFPLTIDIIRLLRGGQLVNYNEKGYDARIGVMPRYGDASSIQWFKVKPNCTFHIINSFEDGDEVVVWGCKALDSVIVGSDKGLDQFGWLPSEETGNDVISSEIGNLFSHPYEWRLNMKSGDVRERYLNGKKLPVDFPMINGAFSGVKNRYGYSQIVDTIASSTSGLLKYSGLAKLHFEEPADVSLGNNDSNESQLEDAIKVETHMFEEKSFCSGSSFVPKQKGVDEDDGWIITFVHNEDTNISQVYVVDTKEFSNEPVAKITLPCRVPYGFHGAFMPFGDRLV